jgi:hypothetical protein
LLQPLGSQLLRTASLDTTPRCSVTGRPERERRSQCRGGISTKRRAPRATKTVA